MMRKHKIKKHEGIDLVKERELQASQASQWTLMYWKFRQHRLAVVAFWILVFFYICAVFADFISPNEKDARFASFQNSPPTSIHFLSGKGFQGPYIYGYKKELDQKTFKYIFSEDKSKIYPIRFFVRGYPYKLLGVFPCSIHLFGSGEESVPLLPFGTDKMGRCLFSRVVMGSQVSLSIGLIGVFISFFLGMLIGGISGYFGGVTDEVIQRTIDFIVSIPTIPLWMALSAAIPRDWPVTKTYFAITIILSLVGWCGLARTVRGKLLSLREEDYAAAAKVSGASEIRIITKHLLPAFSSYLIVSITLSIPRMILSETALSFLGLGMQPPAVSWGVLLQDAQNLLAISNYAWQLIPALFVILVVLMFNFFGDGLRDAADPYTSKQG